MIILHVVKITDFLDEDLIKLDFSFKNKDEALKELSKLISRSENVINEKELYGALVEREKIGSTGIGKGVAIPHAKTEAASKLTIAFGRCKDPIVFDSLDGEGVNIFFIFASPAKDSQIYLKVLARISRLIRESKFREKLLYCKTAEEVIQAIRAEEEI